MAERILVAEDHRNARNILKSYLVDLGYEVVVAEDGNQAWQLYEEERFRLVLTDWLMPGLSGLDLTRMIRQAEGEQRTYIIIITGKDDQESMLVGIAAGADDYITKPTDKAMLARCLQAGVHVSDLRRRLEDLTAAHLQPDLASRFHIPDSVEARLQELEGLTHAFILLEIDDFKGLSSSWGNASGEAVLKEVGRRIREVFRRGDHVSRSGGHRFLIICQDVNPQRFYDLTDRLTAAIGGRPFRLPGKNELSVTCSFGGTFGRCSKEFGVQDFLAVARKALERSRKSGDKVTILPAEED